MTFSPDSPELTAYVLGELDPATLDALETALSASPELAAEVTALRLTMTSLSEAFAAEPTVGLAPEQYATVVQSIAAPTAAPATNPSGPVRPSAELASNSEKSFWSIWIFRGFGWRGGAVLAGGLALLVTGLLVVFPPLNPPESESGLLRYQPGRTATEMASAKAELAITPVLASNAKKIAAVSSGTAAAVVPSADAYKSAAPMSVTAVDRAKETPAHASRFGLAPETRTESRTRFDKPVVPVAPSVKGLDTASLSLADQASANPTVWSAPTPGELPMGRARLAASTQSRGFAPNGVAETKVSLAKRTDNLSALGELDAIRVAGRALIESESAGIPAQLGYKPASALAAGVKANGPTYNRGESIPNAYFYRESLADKKVPPALRSFGEAKATEGLGLRVEQQLATPRLLFAPEARVPGDAFAPVTDNPFQTALTAPLSTFGMDVDTASYSILRRVLREGSLPPADAVRLEELLNYFSYNYPQPKGDHPLGATVDVAGCPWNDAHKLVRIGVKARELARNERPRSNLVFLLDVSGSMTPENRLPLVKRAMRLLIERLSPQDTVGIVTYAGEARVALEPVGISPEGRQQVSDVLETLVAGSGTHGSAGIQNAYAMATNHFIRGGVNRVILCTDGDFNVGITDRDQLLTLITARARSGVFLSVLGFGMDNLKDSTLELLADRGNGNYAYIDSFAEARKVLVSQLDGTLVTVAKDAKIQVEFNPARVARYRLMGYEKRLLRDRDFNDDTKDAGEVGAGHSVTVLYEIEPVAGTGPGVDPLRYKSAGTAGVTPGEGAVSRERAVHTDELLNLKIRYKLPDGDTSRLMEQAVKDGDLDFAKASADFKFAAAVTGYGLLLRHSPYAGDLTWEKVLRFAEQGQGSDPDGYRAEFIDLARKAQSLRGQP